MFYFVQLFYVQVLKSTRNINDFKFSLFYAQGEILPPGISSNEIVTYEVSGVSEAYSKYVILFICLPPLHIISRNIGC